MIRIGKVLGGEHFVLLLLQNFGVDEIDKVQWNQNNIRNYTIKYLFFLKYQLCF